MPTPPKPARFHPEDAPEGVEVRFVTFAASRQVMAVPPRLQLVHTNAASREGTIESAWNWAHARPGSNTLPHYQVDRSGRARKMLPTNRVGIANCTSPPKAQVRNWSLAYETADLGTLAGIGGFTPAQGETLAQILAYEAITHGIPLEYPSSWDGAGTACHTEPYYWSCVSGKNCPGSEKKAQMREWVIPRAREIRAAWTAPPPPVTPLPFPNQEPTMVTVINDGGKYWYYDQFTRREFSYPGNDWALIAKLWETEDQGVVYSTPKGTRGDKDRVIPVPFPLSDAQRADFLSVPDVTKRA